ncbi:unnamed protein product [Peronospora farinosa]|uniref:B30.2/SPRY domain-containing protein n=1 Tax=Peronospora farinosa TaxID=134698 RepID=A0AAV0U4Q9_9STRA|nr:unnamed protein product [Peronospora farinosa]CAI5729901.1 unnamed protein product [Peronospora farinosa]
MNFSDLSVELLAHVLSFAVSRDVESLTVASSVVARDVLPSFPIIWKHIFCRRWESLNFPLDGVAKGDARLEINENLNARFPSSCTESRRFQLLAHAITPVPSYADIELTKKALGYSDEYHRIIPVQTPELMELFPVTFALDGEMLGNDRCVQANKPFPISLYFAVYKRNPTNEDIAKGDLRPVFQVGGVRGGYFELSLSKRQHQHARSRSRTGQDAMTSIGLIESTFPLVGKQPGWTRRSFGYHGDDGRLYHGSAFEGQPFGPVFGAGCTVGCGIRVEWGAWTYVFFTNNGELVADEDGAFVACSRLEWYPAVGLDSYDALHLNFGQEPFVYSTDELFDECNGMGELRWYDICDSENESSEEEESSSGDSSGDDYMSDG